MNLIVWILIGVVVNALFLKDDLLKNKETLLAGIVIVLVRAVTGGVISNFLFEGGIANIDFPTFTLTGLAPLSLLLMVKMYNIQESKQSDTKHPEPKVILGKFVLTH